MSKSRGSRKSPSKGDRHTSKGTPIAANGRSVRAVLPPVPREGQATCPTCRNAVAVTPRGNLRGHSDLFGNRCPNRSTWTPTEIHAPDVHLPPIGSPPRAVRRDPATPARLDVGSECRECGKWLPGERSLCGRCSVRAERGRAR